MGHMGKAALRKLLNHHNIKATGKFENCISCMKWKTQNKKKVSKVASNPAKYPGECLHIDAGGLLPLPMGRKEYWFKIRDEYSGYSWDYFMSEKSSATTILQRQLQWMKASGMRVKTVRCDNTKEQMAPLKDMCWENGVLVEYVAPCTPQQNGKVERQFPIDLKRANAMLDTVKLGPAHKMKFRKKAIQYASTMANISINYGTSPHEKCFEIPSPITPEHCVDFGRIGYIPYGKY
jgi:transposase InsO family protein